MAQKAITASWALNTTSDNVFAVARGVLTAATSDNVQPLVLLTAEAFGGTLGICQQTLFNVGKQAQKKQHSVIKYLQAQVGYFANDSASHLSSSANGVRFLSLVAMLLCSSSHFEAAKALDLMIRASSFQGQMIPTVIQLQDLIQALEAKLTHTGFADEIYGWRTLLLANSYFGSMKSRDKLDAYPGPENLRALVDAFRTLMRLGETTSEDMVNEQRTLVISAEAAIPWIISYAKWCSGIPPNVFLEDGTSILCQPGSRIAIHVVERAEPKAKEHLSIKIELFEAIDSPSQLWEAADGGTDPWIGLISVSNFAVHRVSKRGMHENATIEALALALSYALPLALKHIHPLTEYNKSMGRELPVFPPEHEILCTYREYFEVLLGSTAKDLVLREVTERLPFNFHHLPGVMSSTKHLRSGCSCDYHQDKGRVTVYVSSDTRCLMDEFWSSVREMTADILALSLVESARPFKVCYPVKAASDTTFILAINEVIFGTAYSKRCDARDEVKDTVCDVRDILERSLALIGHTMLPVALHVNDGVMDGCIPCAWIASASKGQVAFRNFFEHPKLDGGTVHMLGIVPGVLRYQQCEYNLVRCAGICREGEFHRHPEPVDRIRNLMGGSKIVWQVSIGEARSLSMKCGFLGVTGYQSPLWMLLVASRSLFVSSCEHDKNSKLDEADERAYYITPYYTYEANRTSGAPEFQGSLMNRKIAVVPSAGNDEHRFLALAGGHPGVIRGNACLACCLRVCRENKYEYVIL